MKNNLLTKCTALLLTTSALLSPISSYALIEPTEPVISPTALSFNTTIDIKDSYPRYEQYHELTSGEYEIKATAIVDNKGEGNSGLKLIVACADRCRVNNRTLQANETISELNFRDIGRYKTYNKRFNVAAMTRAENIKVFVRVMGLEGAAGEISDISFKSCGQNSKACAGRQLIRNGNFSDYKSTPLNKQYPANWEMTVNKQQAGVNLSIKDGNTYRSVLSMNSLVDQDVRSRTDVNLIANRKYELWSVAKTSFAQNDNVTINLICNNNNGCTYTTGSGKIDKPAKARKGEILSQIVFKGNSGGFKKNIATNGPIYLTQDSKAILEVKAEDGSEILIDSIRLTARDTRYNPEPIRNWDFDHAQAAQVEKMQPNHWGAGSGNWGHYTGSVIQKAVNY